MNYITVAAIGYISAIIVLVGVIVFQAIANRARVKSLEDERQDLMNRFMARDFREFAGGTRVLKPTPTDVDLAEEALNADEDEKRMADGLSVV